MKRNRIASNLLVWLDGRLRLQLGDPLLRLDQVLALLELLDQLLEVGQRFGFLLGS